MSPITNVLRVPLNGDLPVDQAIENLCALQYAAGYALVGCFVVASDLVLIFQLPLPPTP